MCLCNCSPPKGAGPLLCKMEAGNSEGGGGGLRGRARGANTFLGAMLRRQSSSYMVIVEECSKSAVAFVLYSGAWHSWTEKRVLGPEGPEVHRDH